jgi:tetratricopeptide (TPR) repeat protein
MEWWTQNKDAIAAIVTVLGAIGTIATVIWAAIKWGYLRWWQRRLRIDIKVFELITDPAVLLPKLYATENDNSFLADHNIKYQPRDPDRDLQGELKATLNRSRYLLITAPTGYGKTREAGLLAQTMILEGWRVLMIRNTGWLDVPKTLPMELKNNRSRVLIFLDDLNGLFSTGERTQSPRAEKIPLLSEPSYHDRLLQVLDMLEGMCTKKEIRVIATARSEADQWSLLNFNSSDRLWQRFERIELLEPKDSTIVNLLDDTTKLVELKANHKDFAIIAHKSDGTYRNIVLNLRRWYAQNQDVSQDDFTETLDGSWRDIYERAMKRYPAVQYIYDAIEVLQQANIYLIPTLVYAVAVEIWGGNILQKFLRRIQIELAGNYLTHETKILRKAEGDFKPSEGQIEAKGAKIDWSHQILAIEKSIVGEISAQNLLQTILLFTLGYACLELNRNEDAIRIWSKIPADKLFEFLNKFLPVFGSAQFPGLKNFVEHLIQVNSSPYTLHFLLGLMLEDLGQPAEAEEVYRQLISNNPNDAYAQTRLGDVLRALEQYGAAEEAYHQAIDSDPDYAHAYSRLGSLLRELERYPESEYAYREAIDKDPNDAFAYFRFGTLLRILERYSEAEKNYQQAIDKNLAKGYLPDLYLSLGNILRKQKRFGEALIAFQKGIELKWSDQNAPDTLVRLLRFEANENNVNLEEILSLLEKLVEISIGDFSAYLAISSIEKQLGKTVSISHIEKTRQLISENDWYNRACLESICDNPDLAFRYLQQAKQNEKFDCSWAWKDPDLQWIRNDPRFVEIVGPDPENKNSEI